jgi:predicted enzyme related to lactoylglutathione lyase
MTTSAVQTRSDSSAGFTKAFSSFSVNDLQAAKDFYAETLGIIVKEEKEGLNLQFENGQSVFIYPKSHHQPATFTVLNLAVDDISSAVKKLGTAGIKFESYDGEMQTDENGIMWGKRHDNGPNIAWFKDPAGNFLSVVEA